MSWGPTRFVRTPAAAPSRRGQPGKHAGRAPRLPFAALITGLIVGGLSLLLLLNTASAANEVHRHNLADRDAGIAAQVQGLQNAVAASAAPQNLANAAAALGMVPAMNPAFLVIARDGRVRVLGSPSPVTGFAVAVPPHPAPRTTTATATDTSTASTTSAATTSSTATTTSTAQPHGTDTSSTPTPTPTPTPTLTLPGGNR